MKSSNWQAIADEVISGSGIERSTAVSIIESADEELMDLVSAASRIRQKHFGNSIQLYFLMNAKSGLCPEDCHYCTQSKVSDAPVTKYTMLQRDQLMAGAKAAAERQSKTYCIVISGRSPTNREIEALESVVPEIKNEFNLDICACLGLLDEQQANRLAAAGVNRVNHNLNAGEKFYEKICTTHTYNDRVDTLKNARRAGLELCSGGIVGMGEQPNDTVSMAFDLKELEVESIPLNFLHAVDGTPLEKSEYLTPRDCLRSLCMFRFVNPKAELRIAGGRERHLRSLQPMGLMVANSIFVGDYLTTKGQLPAEDYRMIQDLGLEITGQPEAWIREIEELANNESTSTSGAASTEGAAASAGCGSGGGGCSTSACDSVVIAGIEPKMKAKAAR